MRILCVLLSCLFVSALAKKSKTTTESSDDDDDTTDASAAGGMVAAGAASAGAATGSEACQGPAYVTTQAVASLVGDGLNVTGTLVFDQAGGAGPVTISGAVSGLSRGYHGLHIQEFGNTRDGCNATGPDYNPDNYPHGGPQDAERHAGDLGNIKANARGTAVVRITNGAFSLNGDYNVIGRAVVVYQMEDDLGRGNNTGSTIDGNVGQAVACGVIGISAEEPNPAYNSVSASMNKCTGTNCDV